MFKVLLSILLLSSTYQIEYTTYKNVLQTVKDSLDNIVIVWTTSSDRTCKRCRVGEETLKTLIQQLFLYFLWGNLIVQHHPYIKTLVLDCERISIDAKEYQERVSQVCSNSQTLPHITIFEQKSEDISKSWPKDHIYSGVVSDFAIMEYLDKISVSLVQQVDSSRQLTKLLNDKKNIHKIIYMTPKEDTPLWYRTLSTEFRNKQVLFIQIDNENKKLVSKISNSTEAQENTLLYYRNSELVKFYQNEVNTSNYNDIVRFLKLNFGAEVQIDEEENPNLVTKTLNHTILKRYLSKKHDNWVILQITSRSKHEDNLPKYKEMFEELFRYAHLDCKLNDCKTFVQDQMGLVDKLPQTIIYPLGRKSINQYIQIKPEWSQQEIVQVLENYAHSAETSLNQYSEQSEDQENIDGFIRKSLNDNKFPVIWFYQGKNVQQRLFMHTFSNNEKYRATLRFGKVADPNEKTKETYQLVGGFPEPVAFLGIDGITYKKATMNDRPCIIGVLSTFKSGKNKLEMEILENAKNNFSRDYNWAWLDGNCHPEFLKPLRLKAEQLSTVLYFNRKRNRYIRMDTELNKENLDIFLQGLNKKSVISKMIRFEEELDVENTEWKCQRINDELKAKQVEQRKQKLQEKYEDL